MLIEAAWFALVGVLLVVVAIGRGLIARLPLSGALIYLCVGFLIGTAGAGLLPISLDTDVRPLRIVTEAGLVVSLFSIGMHLRVPLHDRLWWLPLRLGFPAMLVTVAIVTGVAIWGLHLTLGAALVLAAALAPTDPVLANELRVREAGDDEPLRFALSGEGGCNDGAAYPVALAGLSLCGIPGFASSEPFRFALTVVWGLAGAALIGWICGIGMVKIVTWLRTRYGEAVGVEGFLALGLMGICYGASLAAHTIAFVGVFVAGVALRHEELKATGERPPSEVLASVQRSEKSTAATDPERAHAYMAESMMGFTLEIERLVEFALMLAIGSAVSAHWREVLTWQAIWPSLVLFLVARPIGTSVALVGASVDGYQRVLIGWLGIRGVGAFYYLLLALEQGKTQFRPLAPVILACIALSVIVHGSSATPALNRYLHSRRVRAVAPPQRGTPSKTRRYDSAGW
ncbi:cation:proton antiporter [Paraburkholderia bengalensis]|uniref:Cation:proton antiporter n=1 Tax=Paraburkholderia bengalensis TaxID=2747562 RepID=A0ABU8J3W5_9BURK